MRAVFKALQTQAFLQRNAADIQKREVNQQMGWVRALVDPCCLASLIRVALLAACEERRHALRPLLVVRLSRVTS